MSRQKQKGTAFETLIVEYLRENGFPYAERSPLHGAKDVGDTLNTTPFVIEMKNHRQISLGAWMDEALIEAVNWSEGHGWQDVFPVVVHKRKGKGWAGHQFVTMQLTDFADMVLRFVRSTERPI